MANPDDLEFDGGFEDDGFEDEDFAEPLEEPETDFNLEAEAESALFEHPDDLIPGERGLAEVEGAAGWAVSSDGRINGNGNGHGGAGAARQAAAKPSRRRYPAKPAATSAKAADPQAEPAGNELSRQLARQAEHAGSAAEAGLLIAALAPLALKPDGRSAETLAPVLAVLMQGAAGAARVIYRKPAYRRYLRCFPEIVMLTVQRLLQAAHTGEPLDPEEAADVLAEITGEVMRKRRHSV